LLPIRTGSASADPDSVIGDDGALRELGPSHVDGLTTRIAAF
jgi:hypothetical protein